MKTATLKGVHVVTINGTLHVRFNDRAFPFDLDGLYSLGRGMRFIGKWFYDGELLDDFSSLYVHPDGLHEFLYIKKYRSIAVSEKGGDGFNLTKVPMSRSQLLAAGKACFLRYNWEMKKKGA